MKIRFSQTIAAAAFLMATAASTGAFAATGCDLNYPDSDVPRLFPESTGYKARYISLDEHELRNVVARLGADYRPLYDPLNVPYTLYDVYKGKQKAGYVHGVNQKGQYGGIQVFVSLDLNGVIKAFYIQKMTGRWAGKFRDAAFGRQFIGISIRDFDTFDPVSGKGTGKIAKIRNPAPGAETDFYSLLRALKKNLVLMDEFVYLTRRKNQ